MNSSRESLPSPTFDQDWLIEVFHVSGWENIDKGGICVYLAAFGGTCFLDTSINDFKNNLKLIRDEVYPILCDIQSALKIDTQEPETGTEEEIKLRRMKNKVEFYKLSQEKFEKKLDLTQLKFISEFCRQIKKSRPKVNLPEPFSNVYTRDTLKFYFESLRKELDDRPCILMLESSNHVIAIGYNPNNKALPWILIDPNQLTKFINGEMIDLSDKEIVDEVDLALTPDEVPFSSPLIFSTRLYITFKRDSDMIDIEKKHIHEWKKILTERIYLLTPENAKLKDSYNGTWLYHAVKDGDIDLVKALIQLGADPLIVTTQGYTCSMKAKVNNHAEILHILENRIEELKAEPKLTISEKLAKLNPNDPQAKKLIQLLSALKQKRGGELTVETKKTQEEIAPSKRKSEILDKEEEAKKIKTEIDLKKR